MRVDSLPHRIERQLITVPLGDTTGRLHRNWPRASEIIGELPNDIRRFERAIDITEFDVRLVDVLPVRPGLRRIRHHDLIERRREGKPFILDIDGRNPILGQILGLSRDDGDDFSCIAEFFRHREVGRRVLGREDIGHARHTLRR